MTLLDHACHSLSYKNCVNFAGSAEVGREPPQDGGAGEGCRGHGHRPRRAQGQGQQSKSVIPFNMTN